MSDRAAVVLAIAVAAGAWWAQPIPLVPALLAAVLAFVAGRPAVLVVAALLLASSLSARAWAGLVPPAGAARVAGVATVLTDPEWSAFGQLRMEVRIDERRFAASARGLPASRLVTRLAGERVRVEGDVRPLTGRAAPHLRRRHVAARIEVTAASELAHPGNAFDRVANHMRRLLEKGAASLPPDRRALFAGFVLGDDRHQAPENVYDFRASGLSHLLAVSGQNVAFALALAAPALRRLRLGPRLAAGVAVLLLFGVLTRWEPTVLRAVAMAAVALLATTVGRAASSLRLLALAVAALLLIDPLLVGSVGFLLSVAASAGIVLLAPLVLQRGAIPRWVAEPLAVTVAAQVAVAPILVSTFGGVPLVSLVANLLAGPAAAPITMWGVVAGLAAGLSSDGLATLLHLPTGALVGWVAGVARWAAGLPAGDVGTAEAIALAGAIALAAVSRRHRAVRTAAVVVVVVVLGWTAVSPVLRPAGQRTGDELTDGARLWVADGATVLVIDRPDPVALLSDLRRARIRRVDLVVARSSSAMTREAILALRRRLVAPAVVLPGDAVTGTYRVGSLAVDLTAGGPRLAVAVRR